MSDSAVTARFGYCGKVPSHRDFLRQRLPADFDSQWNEWLQAVLAVSKEQLGERWLSCYLTAPVWHFAISAQVCGEQAMVGTLIPSVDQVGRHYPFTLAAPIESSAAHFWQHKEWSSYAFGKALKVLDDDIDMKKWAETLLSDDVLSEVAPELASCGKERSSDTCLVLAEQSGDGEQYMLHQLLKLKYGQYCIWWTEGSELVPECTLITSKLPLVSQFAAMLDGDWQAWGW